MKIVRVGKEVNWPAGEPIPQSMEEALALGWEVSGGSGGAPDEFSESGETWLHKYVGQVALHLTIPYHTTIAYGAPEKPTARIITETQHFKIVAGSVELLDGSDGMIPPAGSGKVN